MASFFNNYEIGKGTQRTSVFGHPVSKRATSGVFPLPLSTRKKTPAVTTHVSSISKSYNSNLSLSADVTMLLPVHLEKQRQKKNEETQKQSRPRSAPVTSERPFDSHIIQLSWNSNNCAKDASVVSSSLPPASTSSSQPTHHLTHSDGPATETQVDTRATDNGTNTDSTQHNQGTGMKNAWADTSASTSYSLMNKQSTEMESVRPTNDVDSGRHITFEAAADSRFLAANRLQSVTNYGPTPATPSTIVLGSKSSRSKALKPSYSAGTIFDSRVPDAVTTTDGNAALAKYMKNENVIKSILTTRDTPKAKPRTRPSSARPASTNSTSASALPRPMSASPFSLLRKNNKNAPLFGGEMGGVDKMVLSCFSIGTAQHRDGEGVAEMVAKKSKDEYGKKDKKRMYESMRQRKSNQNSTSTVEYVLLSRKGPDALDRNNVKIYNSSVGKKAALVIKIPDGKSSSMFVSDE